MSQQHVKKTTKQKAAASLSIYSNLIADKRFLEALVILWPLVIKGDTKLQEDCATLAREVFKDESFLSATELTADTLHTLYSAARNLIPQNPIYFKLREHYFNSIWQNAEYEKLEKILKSPKEEFSSILLENISKLSFFQAEKKIQENPFAFVSLILTGGACLIIRNSLYHKDASECINLLANEIKLTFSQLQLKEKQTITFNKVLFENFIDYEAYILKQILELAIADNQFNLSIIPTPGYFIAYDTVTKRIDQNFLSWLASKNKTLFDLYHTETVQMILWILSNQKSSNLNYISKSLHQNKFSPYLKLAVMFIATNNKYSPLKEIVTLNDFCNLNESTPIFKNIAIKIVKSTIKEESSPEFLDLLLNFHSVFQEVEFKNTLITKQIHALKNQYKQAQQLNFDSIKNTAIQLNSPELKKHIDILIARREECIQFLNNIENEKQIKDIIKNIKNEAMLKAHLTLIADCSILIYQINLSTILNYVKNLTENKRINKIIPIRSLFKCNFQCGCTECQRNFSESDFQNVINELNLPISSLPEEQFYLQPISQEQTPKPSILLQADPFKTLDILLTDSKQIIMQKVMKLSQQFPNKMGVFRQAQNEVFNPAQRFLHQYFRLLTMDKTPLQPEFLNAK